PAARYMIKKLLRATSYHVVESEDANAGLEAAGRTHPDIIVVDLGLPDLSGAELMERLQGQEGTRDIPIVVATSRELSSPERVYLQQPARAVLSKRDLTTQMLPTVMEVLHATGAGARP